MEGKVYAPFRGKFKVGYPRGCGKLRYGASRLYVCVCVCLAEMEFRGRQGGGEEFSWRIITLSALTRFLMRFIGSESFEFSARAGICTLDPVCINSLPSKNEFSRCITMSVYVDRHIHADEGEHFERFVSNAFTTRRGILLSSYSRARVCR